MMVPTPRGACGATSAREPATRVPTNTEAAVSDAATQWAAAVARWDRPGPRYTSYPTAREFHEGITQDEFASRLRSVGASGAPLSVYVHLPFCRKQCLYCACATVISPHGRGEEGYIASLVRELDILKRQIGRAPAVSQLHLGGGTPTTHEPETLGGIIEAVDARFPSEPTAERSIEIDPRVTRVEHLDVLQSLGFTRISFGVQDLHEPVQRAIGRVQSAEMISELVKAARERGFVSINADLIYGLPLQTQASVRSTTRAVVDMGVDRLAVYGFAYVPWMRKHQLALPVDEIPAGMAKLLLLEAIRDELQAVGYVDVGMDHFARPSDALARAQREGQLGRNFMGYTTDDAPHVLGVGLSSISFLDDAYFQNTTHLATYLREVDAGRVPIARGVVLTPDDQERKFIIDDILCNFRVDRARFERRFGYRFWARFRAESIALDRMVDEELLVKTDTGWEATALGRRLVRNIAMVFDVYRSGDSAQQVFSRTV